MRDLLVFLIVVAVLPRGFRKPFIGLLLFSWLAYMRPQDLCWGFARNIRFSFYAAITMVVGWIAHEAGRRKFFRADVRTNLMLVLLALVTAGFAMAEDQGSYVTRYYIEFLKIIAVALFTTGQVDTKERLRSIYWLIAICLGFYGLKTGVLGILGGGSPVLRGPGGLLEDNNDFALALTMNIPLLYYLGRDQNRIWVRQACDFTILMTMVGVLLTHSRGAFLAMGTMLMFIAWRSGRLAHALGAIALLVVAFFTFAPDHVIERIALIGEGTAESSAGARIKAWTIAIRMIQANPVFGVGIRNFQVHWDEHSHGFGETEFAFVAHNSYLQIWAECGSIAFVVYMALLLSVFATCRWIRRRSKRRPEFSWAYSYARMMEATMIAFMIGAFFLNRGHFDLIYHWLGLTTCLSLVFRAEWVASQARERAGTAPDAEPVQGRPAHVGLPSARPRLPRRPPPRWERSPNRPRRTF